MTSVVATIVLVLLVAAWWSAAAHHDRVTRAARARDRTSPDTVRAVFGHGLVTDDGTWRPVGLPSGTPRRGGSDPRKGSRRGT